jgi:hypothetical protein
MLLVPIQTDDELKALPEQPKRRSSALERKVRRQMLALVSRDPTPEELEADRRYWEKNPNLFKASDS